MPRIDYPDLGRLEPEYSALIEQIKGERGSLLLNSPEFARGWLNLGTAIRQQGILEDRLRELVILRVSRLLPAAYVWSTHVEIARRAGATQEQLDALAESPTAPCFSDRERVALQYAATMTERVSVPDELFERVREHFSPQEILELTVTIGFYNSVCRVLIALHLDEEPGFEAAPFGSTR